MREVKVGTTIYHASRYWKTDGLTGDEVPGWNARYLPYVVVKVTANRIYAEGRGPDGKTSSVQFPRAPKHKPRHARPTTLEADGKQYHSRFHEYFYTEIPRREEQRRPRVDTFRPQTNAAAVLGLSGAYTAEDANRAYKRLARQHHPDAGGSHEAFVRLKQAHEAALRTLPVVSQDVSGRWRCSCGAWISLDIIAGSMGRQLAEAMLAPHRMPGHRLTKEA